MDRKSKKGTSTTEKKEIPIFAGIEKGTKIYCGVDEMQNGTQTESWRAHLKAMDGIC